MSSNPVAETVASLMPAAKAELTELVAFKSVADFGHEIHHVDLVSR